MLVENCSYPQDFRVRHEAKALTEAGYEVSVISPSSPNQPWRETIHGVYILRYPTPIIGTNNITYLIEYSYSLLVMFFLSFLIFCKPGFDIIHTANPPDISVFIAVFYKLFGKKFIFDQHDLSPEVFLLKFSPNRKYYRLVHKVLLMLEKFSCSMSDHVIVPNQSYKSIVISRDRVPSQRITIVRNGPDLEEKNKNFPINDLRRSGKKTLLYLGVIGSQDGVDYLLRSINILKNNLGRNDFICVIAGGGNALSELKDMSVNLGLESIVFFPGWVESNMVASFIDSADICLAPEPSNYLNDNSTMVKIMEYMEFGKPVVAFDLPENRITAQNSALYAKPNDELNFAQKISLLMDDPVMCREMGSIGRDRIEKKLAWEYQAKNLLKAYTYLSQEN